MTFTTLENKATNKVLYVINVLMLIVWFFIFFTMFSLSVKPTLNLKYLGTTFLFLVFLCNSVLKFGSQNYTITFLEDSLLCRYWFVKRTVQYKDLTGTYLDKGSKRIRTVLKLGVRKRLPIYITLDYLGEEKSELFLESLKEKTALPLTETKIRLSR